MNIFTVTMAPVNPPYDDGVKNMVINTARRVKKHTFFFVSSFFGKRFGEEENVEFFNSVFQKQGRHSASFPQKVYVFILLVLNIRKMDIFQFAFTPQRRISGVLRVLMKSTAKRSVQMVTSIHTLYSKNGGRIGPELFFADRVAVCSDYAKNRLEEIGVPNVVRVYPGIDPNRFENITGGGEGFAPGAFSEEGPNVVYAGTYKLLRDTYSLEDFCGIVARAAKRDENVRFVMACRLRTKEDVLLQEEFKRSAERAGIIRHLTFLNTVENMPLLFKTCDMGIMPARRPMSGVLEIPMVLMEMACLGKPVLYGKVAPLEELSDKGIGVMLSDDSPGAYSDKIVQLLEDKKLAESVGQESREAVKKFFNMDNMACEYEKLYDALKG